MFERSALFAAAAFAGLLTAGCSQDAEPSDTVQLSENEAVLVLVERARARVSAGELERAGQVYDEALELEPQNPGLWVDIARLRFLGGEQLEAIEAADYALELGPNFAPALLLRAQMVRDANGLEEALVWYQAANAADPENPEILGDYASTLGDLGYARDMLTAVRDLDAISPGNPQGLYLRAVLAARGDNPELAARLLARSGLREAGKPAVMMLDALINMQQGNFDTASATLEDLADRQPGNMRVQELLARNWWLSNRDNDIVERFAQVAERREASPYLTMLVGRSFERMGDRLRGLQYIERARAALGEGAFALAEQSSLPDETNGQRRLIEARNFASARAAAQNVLRRFPQSGDAHALAGDVALASGDNATALELYSVAARVRRSWPLTRKIYQAMLVTGEEDAAKTLLSRYVAGDPQNSDALLALAKHSAGEADWLRVAVLLDTAIAHGAGRDLAVLRLRAEAARQLENEADADQVQALLKEIAPAPFL